MFGGENHESYLKIYGMLAGWENVFRVLARQNVDILRTKQKYFSIYPEITVLVSSRQELNKILDELNQHCIYEVQLVETQASVKCDFCKNRDCCSKIKKFFAFFLR